MCRVPKERAARITVAVLIIAVALTVVSCASSRLFPKEVSRDLLDVRVISEHYEIITDHVFQFDFVTKRFCKVPERSIVFVPAKYQAQYRINYENGDMDYVWETVDRGQYAQLKTEIYEKEKWK